MTRHRAAASATRAGTSLAGAFLARTFLARAFLARAFLAAALLVVAWATLAPDGTAPVAGAPRLCLSCGASRFTDAAANVLLFVPLGAALVCCGVGVARAALLGLVVSAAIELAQLAGFPPGRVVALADLLCNATGALIGSAIARHRHALRAPRPAHAATFALSWAGAVSALLLATAWLVGDPHPMPAAAAPIAQRSPLPFTPGYGWFQGTVTRAVIDGADFEQAFNGPLIVQSAGRRSYSASIAATGHDRRTTVVPMLFLHRVADTLPVLMIAQRGDRLLLRGDSRAARLGFAAPDLLVPYAEAPLPTGGSASATPRSIVVAARVSPRALSLAIDAGSARRSVELLRTATVSWALMQSIVPLTSRYGALVTLVWLALLVAPLGYWAWLSGARRAFIACGGVLLLSASLWAGVQAFAIAYPPSIELGAMLTGLFVGFAAGRLAATRRG